MPALAMYRRWRSRTFAEIIGQDHVTHTLLNALRAGRIAHAYLFAGPRGTGKTTTARVLAKAVNCLDPQDGEPCNRCVICTSLNEGRSLDLIEIDAASNRGIDEIRDLREKIAFSPSECRYKVYVIDEVHMLTNEAFNALLKTLEEPPPHAIFILATTESHRIPLTVLSRCQRFDFRRVALSDLRKKLDRICSQESIRIEAAALDAIGRYATGSFRDAESLLDQLVSYGAEEIRLEDVRRVLGAAPEETVAGIVQALVARDAPGGLRLINEALDGGAEPRQFTRDILEHLRSLLLLKHGATPLVGATPEMLSVMSVQAETISLGHLIRVLQLFSQAVNQVKAGVHSQLPVELALVEATLPAAAPTTVDSAPSQAEPVRRAPPTRPSPATEHHKAPVAPPQVPRRPDAAAAIGAAAPGGGPTPAEAAPLAASNNAAAPQQDSLQPTLVWLQQNWGGLLQGVRARSRSVEALLKSCEPLAVEGDVVTLGFYHSFHQERISEEKNRHAVEDALAELAGRPYCVKCVLYGGDPQAREKETTENRRERLLDNPVVSEAVSRYGAKVVDVQ